MDSDLIPTLMRQWGLNPAAAADTGTSGLSAAHWRFELPELLTPALDVHCVTVPLNSVKRVEWVEGTRRHQVRAGRGDVSLLPAGEDRFWNFRGEVDVMHLYLPPGLLREAVEQAGLPAADLPVLLGFDDPFIAALAVRLHRAMSDDEPTARLLVDGLGLGLAAHLAGLSSRGPPSRERRGGIAPARLKRVVDYVEAHLASDLSLAELASVAGFSPYHFSRAFKATTGLPPHRFVTERRIALARRLLVTTELPVIEIAARCGFGNQSHFATLFRRVTGLAPRDFRSRV